MSYEHFILHKKSVYTTVDTLESAFLTYSSSWSSIIIDSDDLSAIFPDIKPNSSKTKVLW